MSSASQLLYRSFLMNSRKRKKNVIFSVSVFFIFFVWTSLLLPNTLLSQWTWLKSCRVSWLTDCKATPKGAGVHGNHRNWEHCWAQWNFTQCRHVVTTRPNALVKKPRYLTQARYSSSKFIALILRFQTDSNYATAPSTARSGGM